MFNRYKTYKLNYPCYLLLFKYGNFFIALNDDAIILNRILNYKIIDLKPHIKVGFPLNSIKKVETH